MRLKNIFAIAAALALLLSCTNAASKDGNSLLWKISGNGLAKPSYLFGTHHLVPISFLDSVKGVKEAFEASEQTIGELDMSNMGEMQMKMMSESLLPEGISYDSLLNEQDRQLLDSTLQQTTGVGLVQFSQMKPALLGNLIALSLYQKYYPSLSGEKGIDQYFQDEAAKRFRPVAGLETIDDQIYALLNSQSIERQCELLMCMVKHPETLKKQMDNLQTAYHAYNLDKIRQLYEEDEPDDPCPSTQEEKDVLNKNRNEKWLQQLPELMQEKSSFIAVGCAHLPGKDGLIESLRKLGYKVEPIK